MSSPQPVLIESRDEVTGFSAMFEDNGRVAYLYLRKAGKVVGDVWLYNQGPPPREPEWGDRSLMPFRNPEGFAFPGKVAPVEGESDLEFSWWHGPMGELVHLDLWIRGERFARVCEGSKPGWSRLAARKGPLAKPLPGSGWKLVWEGPGSTGHMERRYEIAGGAVVRFLARGPKGPPSPATRWVVFVFENKHAQAGQEAGTVTTLDIDKTLDGMAHRSS
jgi:hypothetical protein